MALIKPTEIEHRLLNAISSSRDASSPQIFSSVEQILLANLLPRSGQVDTFCRLLTKWNRTVNLVGPCNIETLIARHVFDSALATAIISVRLKDPDTHNSGDLRWLDIGSGAGFPGIIIAIMFPEASIALCEPREKRVHFLQEARSALGLNNVTIHKCRLDCIEIEHTDSPSIAVTRATGMGVEFLKTLRSKLPDVRHFAELTTTLLAKRLADTGENLAFLDTYKTSIDQTERCVALWKI